MAMSFRASRFRHGEEVGEDVNPSAYIVNLADCMLVLAVGFAVALISHWNIPLANIEQVDESQMEAVDSETLPEDVLSGGSYYEEAGTAYRDPATGQLYIIEGETKEGGDGGGTGTPQSGSTTATATNGQTGTGSAEGASAGSTGSANNDAILNARASGGD